MKTKLLFLFMFLIFAKLSFGWSVEVQYPTRNSCWPTNITYTNQSYIEVRFNINSSGDYHYYVQLIELGQILYTSSTYYSSGGDVTEQIPIQYICLNNNATVKVVVHKDGTSEENPDYGYFILYSELISANCPSGGGKLGVVNGQVTLQTPNSFILGLYSHCGGLAGGNYVAKRYKIEWWKPYPSNANFTVYQNECYGLSAANPNNQNRWGWSDGVQNGQGHFYTFVYDLYTIGGSHVGWWPCSPQQAAVAYTVTYNLPPIISSLQEIPPIIYTSGIVRCNLSQGNCCNVTYNFWWTDKPANVSVTHNSSTDNYVTVTYSGLDKIAKNGGIKNNGDDPLPPFLIWCQAQNQYGSSNIKNIMVTHGIQGGGGCPWIYVLSDGGFIADNNILHKSEFAEYQGIDITDDYKLRVAPLIQDDNTFVINIMESSNDLSYFDQVRLLAIDHPAGTKIDITENNQIVLYDSVQVLSTDAATQNGNDITQLIQYNFPNNSGRLVSGDTLDHLYTHFQNQEIENAAIITEMQNDWIVPVVNKDWVGHINIQTTDGNYESNFSRRENSSVNIIPVGSSGTPIQVVDNANFDMYRKYKVKYIALTHVSYDGFSQSELRLVEAIHSDWGDMLEALLYKDDIHAQMDSTQFISLKFQNIKSQPDGWIRDYVFETSGRYGYNYGNGNGSRVFYEKQKNELNSVLPSKYELNQNYPNPFNPVTTIKYSILKPGLVKLIVYDILGREVITLANEIKQAGIYSVNFDATNYASGVYFYRLEASDFVDVKKMVVIK